MEKNYEAAGLTPELREAALESLRRYRAPNRAWEAVTPEALDAAHVAYMHTRKQGLTEEQRAQAIRDAMMAPMNTREMFDALTGIALEQTKEEVKKDFRAWALPTLIMGLLGAGLYPALGNAALAIPVALWLLTVAYLAAPIVMPKKDVRIPGLLQMATGGTISLGAFTASIALYGLLAYVVFLKMTPTSKEAELALHKDVLQLVELTAAANEAKVTPEDMEKAAKTWAQLNIDADREANALVAKINVQRRRNPITVKAAPESIAGKTPTAYLVENETRTSVTYRVGEVIGPDPVAKDLKSILVTYDGEPAQKTVVTLPRDASLPSAGTRFVSVQKEGEATLLEFRPFGGAVESLKKLVAQPAVLNEKFDAVHIQPAKLK